MTELKRYILYNPLSGNGRAAEDAALLKEYYGGECEVTDITGISDLPEFLSVLKGDDSIVICGGDGTLNRFVNDMEGAELPCSVFYHACGTGNDFLHDIECQSKGDPIDITSYLADLPTVTVNGISRRFINNVGFGIDGYCCEVGDALKARSDKPVNYTMIAIKGLLLHFKPRGVTVTVDGVTHRYENAWLAPTMKGRFYGGGMMPTPDQDRLDPEGELSVMVMHGKSKIKTLMIFPSIFSGTHIKHTEAVKIHKGREIRVVFDTPAAVQIDGETVSGVKEYEARSNGGSAVDTEKEYDTAII